MMSRLQSLGLDIREGIRARPWRAMAAWCAVMSAVLLLTLLTAVLGGLEARAQRLHAELGANTFALHNGQSTGDDGATGLLRRHVTVLEANLPGCRVAAARRYDCRLAGGEHRVPVLGISGPFAEIRAWRARTGRLPDAEDERRGERHAVVGRALAERHGWRVGDFIVLEGMPFRLVGLLAGDAGSLPVTDGRDEPAGDDVVYVPLRAAAVLNRGTRPASSIDMALVQAPPGGTVARTVAVARRVLDSPGFLDGRLTWVTPDSLVRGLRKLQKTIALAAGGVVGLCLALAGTTLVSLMLLTVRERVAEIGLRRAIGATPADIAGLFLAEALLIAGTAAATAGGIAALVLRLSAARVPLPLRTDAGVFWPAFLAALCLGMLCAAFPAYYAARLRPADALRTD